MKTKKKIAVVAAVAGAGLLVWAVVWLYERATEKVVISVDYIARYNEMQKPEGYEPEEDGADLYMQACSAVAGNAPDFSRPGSRVPWPGDLNDVQVQSVKDWLGVNQEALRLAEESIAKKYCWVKRDAKGGWMLSMLIPELSGRKELVYAFIWRGKLKAFDGDVAGGLQDVMLPAQLGGIGYGKSPVLVEWIVQTAILGMCNASTLDIAAHTDLSSSQLKELAARIEQINEGYKVTSAMEAENLFFYDAVQRTFTDDGHGNGHAVRSELRQAMMTAGLGSGGGSASPPISFLDELNLWWTTYRLESRRATIARWDRAMAMSNKLIAMEPWQVANDAGKPWEQFNREICANSLTGIMMPAWDKMGELNGKHTVSVRGTLGTIAVLRYRKDKGSLPQGWEEVVAAGYLKKVPIDSFSGKPLVYRVTGDGFTVYSVGSDGVDDGGTSKEKKDIVVWPVEQAGRQ